MTQTVETLAVRFPRPLLVLMGTAAATITVAGMRGIAGLLGPVFLALVLTIAVHPLRSWLHGRGLPGWAATATTIVAVYAFLIVFALALVVATARFATILPTYKEELTSSINDVMAWLTHLGVDPDQVEAISGSFDVGKLVGFVSGILSGLLGALSDLFFIVALLLFLAFDGAWFPHRLADTPVERSPLVSALVSSQPGPAAIWWCRPSSA